MLFTSLRFDAFFVVVFVVHWVLPRPVRRGWLLIASYFFYMQVFPAYGFLIGGLTMANYLGGWAIWRMQGRPRKLMLTLMIIANLLTLAYFKYVDLFLGSIVAALRLVPHTVIDPLVLGVVLPLGISFFTFEFIHYAVEVYRGQPPIRNPIDFALFAAFFPTQIAGPIKRFPDWVKQSKLRVRLSDVQAQTALGLILRGTIKKVVVADMLAPLVTVGFAHPERLGSGSTWLVIYAFAAQIYADFSGYTDIGRGCALLLGYSVPENFNRPYQALNPGDFWERWHISLSRWLRDYLFIPLGGSRVPRRVLYRNLMITMALGGLWHGASWHYMFWGVYQGTLLIGHRLFVSAMPAGLRRVTATRHGVLVGQVVTFHLVCLGWVIFRAATLPTLWTVISHTLLPGTSPWLEGISSLTTPALSLAVVVLAVTGGIVVTGWLGRWVAAGAPRLSGRLGEMWARLWQRGELVLRPTLYLAMLMLILFWPAGAVQRFIYFQF